ncbi:MAG: hypothetical protein KIT14_14035 [bacterium]|nr:hypothetical protein [bacterium]
MTPELAELLRLITNPATVRTVPPERIASLRAAAREMHAALGRVEGQLDARWEPAKPAPDVLLDMEAVAALTGYSPSWLRKRGHQLAGFHQPRGRGGKVGWWRAPLRAALGLASDT